MIGRFYPGRFVYQVRKLLGRDSFSDVDFGQSTAENSMAHLAFKLCNEMQCDMCVVCCDLRNNTASIQQRITYKPEQHNESSNISA